MADNTTLNAGSGGDNIRTIDRAGVKTAVGLVDVGGTSGESLIGDSGVTMPVGGLAANDAAISGNPVPLGLHFDDVTPNVADEGDVIYWRGSTRAEAYVQIRDAAGNERGLNVDASGNITVNVTGTVTVDGSGVTQPVSNAGLTELAAAINSSRVDVSLNTLPDTSGGDLAAISAGFAAEGSALGSGVLLQGDDGTDRTNVLVDTAGHLQVDVLSLSGSVGITQGGNTLSVLAVGTSVTAKTGSIVYGTDGTVTRIPRLDSDGHAQVDVLTSALPSGAATAANQSTANTHLANAVTALQIIDDWDESDRAKVNLIAGQAGVAGGTGTDSATTQRVSLATDIPLPAGTNAIGKLAANSGVDIGDVDVTSVPQGTSHYRNIDANAEDEIKGSAGTLYWMHVINRTAAIAYLHLYDATAASVTPGSTTPTYTFAIPTQGDTNGAGFALPLNGGGQAFANGITLVCTTTLDGSAGDPGMNGVIVNAGYE